MRLAQSKYKMIPYQTLDNNECVILLLPNLSAVFDTIDHSIHPAPVAQLVKYRAVTREVVSSTPAGPTLRVLK